MWYFWRISPKSAPLCIHDNFQKPLSVFESTFSCQWDDLEDEDDPVTAAEAHDIVKAMRGYLSKIARFDFTVVTPVQDTYCVFDILGWFWWSEGWLGLIYLRDGFDALIGLWGKMGMNLKMGLETEMWKAWSISPITDRVEGRWCWTRLEVCLVLVLTTTFSSQNILSFYWAGRRIRSKW